MLYAIVALLVIILDQWTKYWVAGNIVLNTGSKELIPGIVSLVNVHNEGAAFGFLSGANAQLYLIAICGVFSVAVIILLATRVIRGELGRWSAVFVMAGGIGNCIDRLLYGFVQDMFKLDFFPKFAVFNVADVFITVFAFLFILYILFGGNKKRAVEEVEFEDEDEEDRIDYVDDDEEEERPRRKARKEKKERKPARRRDEEDEDFDDEDEEDEPVKPRKAAAKKVEAKKAEPKKPEPKKASRRAEARREEEPEAPAGYEQEYEAFKAARAARQQAAAQPKPVEKPVAAPGEDPFTAWERANARAAQQRPAVSVQQSAPVAPAPAPTPAPAPMQAPVQQPAPTPAPAPQPAAPAASDMEFSLEDILNEFK